MPSEDSLDSVGASPTVQQDRSGEHKGPPSAENLERGARLGRYLVLDLLGRGGMGVVYSAYDPELDRKVAIKLVRAELDGGDEATLRLLREAQAMARVVHPNVVTVHDVGTWEGRVFLAMELVEGSTLREWQRAKKPPRAEILAMYQAAGAGLVAAHAAGLVHRDFKPDNVLVGTDGRARVTDFGLVRPAEGPPAPAPRPEEIVRGRSQGGNSDLTEFGAVIGTPAYMAPEQLEGKVADAPADQFAFAVSLYEALYGERPFEADSVAAMEKAVLGGAVRPAPSGTRIPPWIRRVLLKALSVVPEQRYASMTALLTALKKDPVARARRGAAALALVLLAGSGPAWLAWRAQLEAHRCDGAQRQLDGIWDDVRRAQLERAYHAAVGLPPGTWEQVRAWADTYAQRWREAWVAACEASHSDKRDARIVGASTRCIEARRLRFKAVTDLLLTADADALALGSTVFGGVGYAKSCLATEAPAIEGSGSAELVELMARAQAHRGMGHLEESKQAARRAVELTAGKPDQRALSARAHFELGLTQVALGATDEGQAAFREALLEAEAVGEGELTFEVRLALGHLLAHELSRYDEALYLLAEAQAVADRLTLPTEQLTNVLLARADALSQADRPVEALSLAERALALTRANPSTPSEDAAPLVILANIHSNLGHVVEASRAYEEYLAVVQARPIDTAGTVSYAGEQLIQVGEYRRGIARLEAANALLPPTGWTGRQAIANQAWIAAAWASLGDRRASAAAAEKARAGRAAITQPTDVAELLGQLAVRDQLEGRLSASVAGWRECATLLAPTADVNRSAMLEMATTAAESLRRLGRLSEAVGLLRPPLEVAEKSASELVVELAYSRVELALLTTPPAPPPPALLESSRADLAVLERNLGSDNPDLGNAVSLVGTLEGQLGLAAGRGHLERAAELALRRPGDSFTVAETRFRLACALTHEPVDLVRARALAQRALEGLEALPEPVPLTAEVRRWLAAHR